MQKCNVFLKLSSLYIDVASSQFMFRHTIADIGNNKSNISLPTKKKVTEMHVVFEITRKTNKRKHGY